MFPDYLELLQLLNSHKVRYLIIGGYAVIQYAEPRNTKALDIWIDCSSTNAIRALKAFEEFGAPVDNLSVEDLSSPGLLYVFGIPPLRVDVLNRAKGARFETAWKSRSKVELDGVKVNFVSKDVLIKLKRKSGRPQDLADLKNLGK